MGKHADDQVEFDIREVFPSDDAIAHFLGLAPEAAQSIKGNYLFKIKSINRIVPAELNQELFNKVFGLEEINNNEAFIAKIKETIGNNYQRETDRLLEHEIQHHFVRNTPINMPEGFLKNWLKLTSEGKITDEVLEAEFNQYKDSLKWDLIKTKIAEDHNLSVEAEEVKLKAKELIMGQFGGQAFAAQLGDKLDAIADNYLSGNDGKNYMNIYSQLRQEKIIKAIREKITIEEDTVSLEEFNKIAENHNH